MGRDQLNGDLNVKSLDVRARARARESLIPAIGINDTCRVVGVEFQRASSFRHNRYSPVIRLGASLRMCSLRTRTVWFV